MSIAPEPLLPIALNATAVCLGCIAAILAKLEGTYIAGEDANPDHILLAGLLAAHCGMGGDGDQIGRAYEDFRRLTAAREKGDRTS